MLYLQIEQEGQSWQGAHLLPAHLSKNYCFTLLPVEIVVIVHEGQHVHNRLPLLCRLVQGQSVVHHHHHLVALLHRSPHRSPQLRVQAAGCQQVDPHNYLAQFFILKKSVQFLHHVAHQSRTDFVHIVAKQAGLNKSKGNLLAGI